MDEMLLNRFSNCIFNYSGLQITAAQYSSLKLFLEKKAKENGKSLEDFCETICQNLEHETSQLISEDLIISDLAEAFAVQNQNNAIHEKNKKILHEIVNFITVNETYFFREEKQFDFLQNEIFPKYMGKKMNIWSAACSTGEEPLSLLSHSRSCNIDSTVYATDIDQIVLQKFKRGQYTNNSFRKDGAKYHHILAPYITKKDENFVFIDKKLINSVKTVQFNLTSGKNPFPEVPEKMDLIFIRNVFIYFDVETRKKVLKFLSSMLKEDGILLFSISEIASIDDYVIPKDLIKINSQDVYYFRHKTAEELKNDVSAGGSSQILSTNLHKNSFIENNSDGKNSSSLISAAAGVSVSGIGCGNGNNSHQAISATDAAKEYLQKIRENKESKDSKDKKVSEKIDTASQNVSQKAKTSLNVQIQGQELPQNQELQKESVSVEQVFKSVCNHISNQDFGTAKQLTLQLKAEHKTFQFYIQGYIAYQQDEKTEAEKLFSAAEVMGKDFWPAYFYHGLVLKDVGKQDKAVFCFKKCCEILETTSTPFKYNFLLDSFNPSYIYSLCHKLQND